MHQGCIKLNKLLTDIYNIRQKSIKNVYIYIYKITWEEKMHKQRQLDFVFKNSTSQYNANYVIYHPLTWSQIKI